MMIYINMVSFYQKQWALNNKEKINNNQKKWRSNNLDYYREYMRDYMKIYRKQTDNCVKLKNRVKRGIVKLDKSKPIPFTYTYKPIILTFS